MILKTQESAMDLFVKKFFLQPIKYEPQEVMNAWGKIDRILDKAIEPAHVNSAQRMFEQMLNYFQFTPEQRASPLIHGMQAKINKVREEVNAVVY